MKQLKLIVAAMMLLFGMSVMAQEKVQDSYREAFEACLATNPSAASFEDAGMQMKELYEYINKMALKNYSDAKSEELIEKYMKERFEEDMKTNVMLPSFKRNITEAELREVTKELSTPEGQQFVKANDDLFKNPQSLAKFMGEFIRVGMEVAEGKTPDPVKADKKIPNSYVALWDKFYEESSLTNLLESIIALKGASITNGVEQEIWPKVSQYLRDNFKVIYMNMAFDNMPENLLRYGVKVASMPSYKHMVAATQDMMSGDMQQLGMKFVEGYAEWLDQQDVEIKDDL